MTRSPEGKSPSRPSMFSWEGFHVPSLKEMDLLRSPSDFLATHRSPLNYLGDQDIHLMRHAVNHPELYRTQIGPRTNPDLMERGNLFDFLTDTDVTERFPLRAWGSRLEYTNLLLEYADVVLDGPNQQAPRSVLPDGPRCEVADARMEIENIGDYAATRAALMVTAFTNPAFDGAIDRREFALRQMEAINKMDQHLAARVGGVDDVQLRNSLLRMCTCIVDLINMNGNDPQIMQRVDQNFPGLRTLLTRNGVVSNEVQQLLLSLVIHLGTHSASAHALYEAAAKDKFTINPFESRFISLLEKIDPSLLVSWITSPGSDHAATPDGRGYQLARTVLIKNGSGIKLREEPAPQYIDPTDLKKDDVAIADVVLAESAGTGLAKSLLSKLDGILKRIPRRSPGVVGDIASSLFYLDPETITRLANATTTGQDDVSGVGSAFFRSELLKYTGKCPGASDFLGRASQRVYKLPDGDLVRQAEGIFSRGIYMVGGRNVTLGGLVARLKDGIGDDIGARYKRRRNWPVYAERQKDGVDQRMKDAKPYLRNIMLDELIQSTLSMYQARDPYFGINLIQVADFLRPTPNSEWFDDIKQEARTQLASQMVRTYYDITFSPPDTVSPVYREALNTTFQIALSSWSEADLTTMRQTFVSLLTPDRLRKNPDIVNDFAMRAFVQDETIVPQMPPGREAVNSYQIDFLAGDIINQWDAKTAINGATHSIVSELISAAQENGTFDAQLAAIYQPQNQKGTFDAQSATVYQQQKRALFSVLPNLYDLEIRFGNAQGRVNMGRAIQNRVNSDLERQMRLLKKDSTTYDSQSISCLEGLKARFDGLVARSVIPQGLTSEEFIQLRQLMEVIEGMGRATSRAPQYIESGRIPVEVQSQATSVGEIVEQLRQLLATEVRGQHAQALIQGIGKAAAKELRGELAAIERVIENLTGTKSEIEKVKAQQGCVLSLLNAAYPGLASE